MRLYLDTMVWVYALEGRSPSSPLAQDLLRSIRAGRHTVVASHFLLAEALVLPIRDNNAFLVAAYKRALLNSDFVSITHFDAAAATAFATLRASARIKSPDAIHLALAATASVDAFITTDDRLLKLSVPGLPRISDLRTHLP